MSCGKPPIRAHSIQNARVIDLIAAKNHVISFRPRYTLDGFLIDFKSIGRNEASTFTGLCATHDAELFRPLDTRAFDLGDREQLFLLADRSVTRELHAVMEGAARIQAAYQSRVERGVDPKGEPSAAGMQAVQQFMVAHMTWLYRADHFDRALLAQRYDDIEHDVILLDRQKPSIAVSAMFSLDELVKNGEDVVRVSLNVVPLSYDQTAVVFSYTSEDRPSAQAALSRVLTSAGAYQRYELSREIVGRVENFLIAPAHFATWSEKKVKIIKEAFVATIMSRGLSAMKDHPDLMLF